MWQELITYMSIVMPLILQLAGLTYAVLVDEYFTAERKRLMLLIIFLAFSLIIQNNAEYLLVLAGGGMVPSVRTLAAIYGYSVRPLILLLFIYIVYPDRKHVSVWILVAVNFLVHVTALFSHVCFWISSDNHYHGGPLANCCMIVSFLILVQLLYFTIQKYRIVRRGEALLPAAVVVLIVVSVIVDSRGISNQYQIVSFLTISLVSSILFYYIWLHLQFVWEYERNLRAEQRIQIMMTQIQPHFLYNTLSTIQALCYADPDKAAETTQLFATYLRHNLKSLSLSGLIPFQKELEHTRLYAEIEMTRFVTVRVEYDIQDTDFSLPPLTVQPLVENSIRHGVRVRKEGIVWVITRRRADCHEIVVRDNGRGFDVNTLEKADGTHIGIQNVRDRIEKMCGGSMEIASSGEGTTVTIRIPFQSAEYRGTDE